MKMKRGQKGASAVEFALILPLMLVILFGIIEFGLMLYDKQVITNASREGARAGIVSALTRVSESQIDAIVIHYASSNLIAFGSGGLTTALVPASHICTGFGDDLIVNVQYTYNFLVFPNLIKLINGTFSNSIKLTAQTQMKCE